MKLILLAAAAAIAMPALAQDQTTPPQTDTGAQQQTMPADPNAAPPPPADPNAAAPAPDASAPPPPADQSMAPPAAPTDTAPMSTATPPATPSSTTPDQASAAGGYQPSAPALQGTAQPGVTPRFVPAQSPSEAFPPPPAMDNYPICKKGQFDHCKQGAGSTHSREVRRRK